MTDTIEEQKVNAREESGTKFMGWTYPEMITLALTFCITAWFTGSPLLIIGVTLGEFWYLRHFKQNHSDQFFKYAIKYIFRRHDIYAASQRDSAWRPPVIPAKKWRQRPSSAARKPH